MAAVTAIAPTFCVSPDGPRELRAVPVRSLYRGIFARLVPMRGKKILARTIEIQNKHWGVGGGGVTMHFSEIIKLQLGKNAIRCHVF